MKETYEFIVHSKPNVMAFKKPWIIKMEKRFLDREEIQMINNAIDKIKLNPEKMVVLGHEAGFKLVDFNQHKFNFNRRCTFFGKLNVETQTLDFAISICRGDSKDDIFKKKEGVLRAKERFEAKDEKYTFSVNFPEPVGEDLMRLRRSCVLFLKAIAYEFAMRRTADEFVNYLKENSGSSAPLAKVKINQTVEEIKE